MKRFTEAKSRLRGHVTDAARARLAQAMFERVLLAANGCGSLRGTAVLTNASDVAATARAAGAQVLADAPITQPSLGPLLDAALAQLPALGADSALVLMGDLPYIETQDVEQMIRALDGCDMALAPDRRGSSTNALAVRLPLAVASAFGNPDSYALHTQRARSAGLSVSEVKCARIAHDVDIHEDLPAFLL